MKPCLVQFIYLTVFSKQVHSIVQNTGDELFVSPKSFSGSQLSFFKKR